MKQSIRTHGRTFTGVVVSDKMQHTATVEWNRSKYVPKYERYLTLRTRVKAHNPESVDAREGDIVEIKECRPISKTKHFIITKKLGHEKLYETKAELAEESKVHKEPKKVEKTEEAQ